MNRVMIGLNSSLALMWMLAYLATDRTWYLILLTVALTSVGMGVYADRRWSRR